MEDYDKAIVEAAEAFVDEAPINVKYAAPSVVRLHACVQAKRDAQRPKCSFGVCTNSAVQRVDQAQSEVATYRCAVHKVTVTDL